MKYLFLLALVLTGFAPTASAVQLDAVLLSGEDETTPTFQFLRVIYIEYPNGGELAELLYDKKQTISFSIDGDTAGADKLILQLNEYLEDRGSVTVIDDVTVHYQAILQGNEKNAVIEYKIELIPTITNHIIEKTIDTSLIDTNWRGLSVDEPIIIDTIHGAFDINNPKAALDVMVPSVSKQLDEIAILEIPLIYAGGVSELALHRWHSLFDNTAIIASAEVVGYSGENVITYYSMGQCSIGIGRCDDRESIVDFKLDKSYSIRTVESRDDATILIEGYVLLTSIDRMSVFDTSLKYRESQVTDSGFPTSIMYGMAAMSVIGGVVMFVFSSRKLKHDKHQGQTGVDPADLVVRETSSFAGRYKTNRGESHLALPEKSKTAI